MSEIMENMTIQQDEQIKPQVVTSIGPAPVEKAPIAVAKMTLAAVQQKLAGKSGPRFWKNLDELAATPEFNELMAEEFPRQAGGMLGSGELLDPVSRRGFLKVMGASLTMAGLAGCTKQPDEPIYPYVKQPEDLVLGQADVLCDSLPLPNRRHPGAGQVGCVSSHQA